MTKNAHAGEDRYSEDELRAFGLSVLDRLDVPPERASAMVDHLLTADLMGHRTHGLALLNWYVGQILTEEIQPSGELETLHETPTSVAYSAPGVPGAWAVHRALDALETRMPPATVTTTTIAGCSHVGALQPFLERVTAQNRIVLMAATNPGVASVAPPGGTKAVTTSNPIAVGIPTGTAPILIDQCTSMISNSLCEEYRGRGERLPGRWLLDAEGNPSDDPAVLHAQPQGTILPLGGMEFGYKGYALTLVVEALALGLSGYGRHLAPGGAGEGVFVQIIDPEGFGGRAHFLDEMGRLRERSLNAAAPGTEVRLPGARALRLRAEQRARGVALSDSAVDSLRALAERTGGPSFPAPRHRAESI